MKGSIGTVVWITVLIASSLPMQATAQYDPAASLSGVNLSSCVIQIYAFIFD